MAQITYRGTSAAVTAAAGLGPAFWTDEDFGTLLKITPDANNGLLYVGFDISHDAAEGSFTDGYVNARLYDLRDRGDPFRTMELVEITGMWWEEVEDVIGTGSDTITGTVTGAAAVIKQVTDQVLDAGGKVVSGLGATGKYLPFLLLGLGAYFVYTATKGRA